MCFDCWLAIIAKETSYFKMVAEADAAALKLFNTQGRAAAIDYLTTFSTDIGVSLLDEWTAFFGQLFVKVASAETQMLTPLRCCIVHGNDDKKYPSF